MLCNARAMQCACYAMRIWTAALTEHCAIGRAARGPKPAPVNIMRHARHMHCTPPASRTNHLLPRTCLHLSHRPDSLAISQLAGTPLTQRLSESSTRPDLQAAQSPFVLHLVQPAPAVQGSSREC